jgi:hypothetical protein
MGAFQLENRQLMATLPIGGIHDDSIGVNGEADLHRFYSAGNSIAEISIAGHNNSNGFRADAWVYSPSGVYLGRVLANSTLHSQRFNLSNPGWYTIRVADQDNFGTGAYSVGVETHKPASPSPIAITRGSVLNGTISRNLERDQFVFQGATGNKIELAVTSTSSNPNFRTRARLIAPSGNVEATLLSNTTLSNQQLTLKENGTYVIQIEDDGIADTGSYRIGLEGINPISVNPLALINGDTTFGSITSPIDKKQYTISGFKNQILNITITSPLGGAGQFVADARLYRVSDGLEIGRVLANSSMQTLQIPLPSDGLYMLQVQDQHVAQTGTFKINTFTVNPVSPTATALARNTWVTRTTTDTFKQNLFSLDLVAGQSFSIDLRKTGGNANYTPKFTIVAPNGSSVSYLGGTVRSFSTVSSGKYLIVVHDNYYDALGSFKLKWF